MALLSNGFIIIKIIITNCGFELKRWVKKKAGQAQVGQASKAGWC
jgi:hypothetical protein